MSPHSLTFAPIAKAMFRSLRGAVENRGIVVATPTSVKSIMLCYLENLNMRIETSEQTGAESAKKLRFQTQGFDKILRLFKSGVMLLDEVDLILHPLKSELNFPIGNKFDLDGAERGERWGLPIHLVDAIFYAMDGKLHVFEHTAAAVSLLDRLRAKIMLGLHQRALQRLPHITLLNPHFYHAELKPVLAEWAFLWLEKSHLHGISKQDAISYVLEGAAAKSEAKQRVLDLKADAALLRERLGHEAPLPPKPGALRASLSAKERTARKERKAQLIDKRSKEARSDEQLRQTLEQRLHVVETALTTAKEQQELLLEIYAIEANLEGQLAGTGKELVSVQKQISRLKKQIDEAEVPADDSMFNSVVLVLSAAFAAKSKDTPGSKASVTNIENLCTNLESQGHFVRRCDTVTDATARALELHASKKLRCVIIDWPAKPRKKQRRAPNHQWRNQFPSNPRAPPTMAGSGTVNKDIACHRLRGTLLRRLCKPKAAEEKLYGALSTDRIFLVDESQSMRAEDRTYFWRYGHKVFDKISECQKWADTKGPFCHFESTHKPSKGPSDLPGLRKQLQMAQEQHQRVTLRSQEDSAHSREKIIAQFRSLETSLSESLELVQNALGSLPAPTTAHSRGAIVSDNEPSATGDKITIQVTIGADTRAVSLGTAKTWPELLDTIGTAFGGRFLDDSCEVHPVGEPDIRAASVETFERVVASFSCFVVHPPREGPVLAMSLLAEMQESSVDETESPHGLRRHARRVSTIRHILLQEQTHLNKMILAAKVMANVPADMKKLLNLVHDWLLTFLPHCMKKVNRVSFGLLSDNKCKAALAADALTPPSRLALAVPFVGKDVPSQSSEFAHPDIIIGLSIFAYRYQGLRRADFNQLMDSMTSDFAHEIGPADDRPTSKRYRKWISEAGGSIRGRSNPEQTQDVDCEDTVPSGPPLLGPVLSRQTSEAAGLVGDDVSNAKEVCDTKLQPASNSRINHL